MNFQLINRSVMWLVPLNGVSENPDSRQQKQAQVHSQKYLLPFMSRILLKDTELNQDASVPGSPAELEV